MTDKMQIKVFNIVYDEKGFCGLLEWVSDMLTYGTVKKIDEGFYRISTGGYSEDEIICHNLTHILCKMSKHYAGYICGGAFYFTEEKHKNVKMVLE